MARSTKPKDDAVKDEAPKQEAPGPAEQSKGSIIDREQEQGYRGVAVDPTPNSHYTLAGVTAGKPTPETDEKARDKAREAARDLEKRQ